MPVFLCDKIIWPVETAITNYWYRSLQFSVNRIIMDCDINIKIRTVVIVMVTGINLSLMLFETVVVRAIMSTNLHKIY
jgi:hypothetical protein